MSQLFVGHALALRALGSASSHRSASPDNPRPGLGFQGVFRLVVFASTCNDEMGPPTLTHPDGPLGFTGSPDVPPAFSPDRPTSVPVSTDSPPNRRRRLPSPPQS